MKPCKNCQTLFQITERERTFYDTIKVPEPTHCPDCRSQRRLASRNERTLYRRTCDYSGKEIISYYPPHAPIVVYDQNVWWTDSWDPLDYGRDIDFSRPFFPQFAEFQRAVPHYAVYNMNPVNSEYVNFSLDSKNCYMCFSTTYNEDCLYSYCIDYSRDCVDCTYTRDQSELCYSCVDIARCYRSLYCQNSKGLADCLFCYDCSNCDHCVGSVNLRNASYYWFNEKVTPEEYEQRLNSARLGTRSGVQTMKERFAHHRKKIPRRYAWIMNSEGSTGNHLEHTKNCLDCYDFSDSEDSAFLARGYRTKDCMDSYGFLNAELTYESQSAGGGSKARFCVMSYFNNDIQYCEQCYNSNELFGCVGLNKKKNCIFNKQYSKEEYDVLTNKLIAHMKETGEYGEFFPISFWTFGYNETLAQEYYPLSKESALAKGYHWQDEVPGTRGKETIKSNDIPDDIAAVSDGILGAVLACEKCSKNYKIIKQEFSFYQKFSIPIPLFCHDCRHVERMALRAPRKLVARQCQCVVAAHGHDEACQTVVQTPYAQDSGITIYCESCYQKEFV